MLRWLFWWRHPSLLRACIVNLKDDPDTAFRGVLWASRGEWLTFKDCSLLKVNQPPTKMDGEIVIERRAVLFLQTLP
jgi:hypothetical protein